MQPFALDEIAIGLSGTALKLTEPDHGIAILNFVEKFFRPDGREQFTGLPSGWIIVVFVFIGDGGKAIVVPSTLGEKTAGEIIFVIAVEHDDDMSVVIDSHFG